jgi:hypothetical protein
MNNSSQVRKSGEVLIKEEAKKSDEQPAKKEEVKKPPASDDKEKTDVKPATENKQHDSTSNGSNNTSTAPIITDDKKKEGGFKLCCGRCCRRLGRCCSRSLYYLVCDRSMIFINIIAAAAILISIAERLSWARHGYKLIKDRTDEDREFLRSPEYKENTSSYYYILSAFIIIFTICLVLAEFRNKWMRRTVAVLDTKFGRGFFIIFIGLMIPQNKNGVAIAMSVIANFIGLINLCVGYN